MSVAIPACAFSVLETDVFELARDPEAFGLDDGEVVAHQALAWSVTGKRLRIPTAPADKESVWRLLVDLANTYDERAEVGDDAPFARAASRGLQTLASKVIR